MYSRVLRNLSLTVLALFATAAVATVCREHAVAGWGDRMALVGNWIGDTTATDKIRVYLSKGMHRKYSDSGSKQDEVGQYDDVESFYFHSNFRSQNPDDPTTNSQYPTKVVEGVDAIEDMQSALGNIIFWPGDKGPPADWQNQAARYLKDTEIFIDPDLLGADGRPPFDLSTAKSIMLAHDDGPIAMGKVEIANINRPPPALIEAIAGCCLKGRPAGRGAAISRSLARINFHADDIALLSLVVDSATTAAIGESSILSSAAKRGKNDASSNWEGKIAASLQDNNGKTLVMLTHVSKGDVVIEGASGISEYSVKIDDLHRMAQDSNVNLVLVGCDTLSQADLHRGMIGIVGKYNTHHAVRQLDFAIKNSKSALEFLTNMSSENLQIVTQEGSWSQNAVGATFYSRSKQTASRLHRAFRIWFLGEQNG